MAASSIKSEERLSRALQDARGATDIQIAKSTAQVDDMLAAVDESLNEFDKALARFQSETEGEPDPPSRTDRFGNQAASGSGVGLLS